MNSSMTLQKDKWNIKKNTNIEILTEGKDILIKNKTSKKIEIEYTEKIKIKDKKIKQLKIEWKYTNKEACGACLAINNGINIPINSTSIIEIKPPVNLNIRLIISAEATVNVSDISIEFLNEEKSLIDNINKDADVLIITPDYPSSENLYKCAFAHSRNTEYIKNGLNIQVATISPNNWFQTIYTHQGISVFRGEYKDLKDMLLKHQYKVIVTHFVDEKLFPIFDGYIDNEKLIFICHGPETLFRSLLKISMPYFTKPTPYMECNTVFDLKEKYVKKYSQKDNVEWVFVSEWLKEASEKELNIKFKNVRVINNVINEDLFPYHEKKAEDRCKILVIRKFDNINQHSLDQVVFTILELSRRKFFNKLEFEIYGDGNYYDELIEPIRQFSNVKLHRTFIPNDKISEIHAKSGILLIPSRHDAHAVAMGEGASSGLVVVGSRVTSNPFFMNEKENHTLADPENYIELADIIERLYNNPDEFLRISKNLSEETRKNYCKKNTVQKEIELIKESLSNIKPMEKLKVKPVEKPTLTIAIPAYNVEKYIRKCLNSIIRTPNIQEIEILVINDGSKDKTAEIVKEYIELTNGIVKLVNKENGGHGSTINVAIEKAQGKYFRLVDGDDWVDEGNLAKLVDILKDCSTDIVLTKGSYEYVEKADLVDIIQYDNLKEGHIYNFEDLTYNGYGFTSYGPTLTTGNYRTEVLRKANFKLTEKKPYVDMEFNTFALKCVKTLEYHNLDIYRYLIGRTGQTVSREYWKTKYKEHEYIIFNILETIYNSKEFSEAKKRYVYNKIIAQMVDSQIFMFDTLCLWKEIDPFLNKLKKYDIAYNASMKYIKNKNGNCRLILERYKDVLAIKNFDTPIIIPGVRETIYDWQYTPVKNLKWAIKKSIKYVTPYGLLKLYNKLEK